MTAASVVSADLVFDVGMVCPHPGEAVTVTIIQTAPNPTGYGGLITIVVLVKDSISSNFFSKTSTLLP